jgi:hypothetical protein
VVVDGCRAVHEPSAAGKVCREPFGLLPTRRYVTDDQPHPPDSWSRRRHVRIIVVLARPCHPRAIGSGHQRYVADSHGHSAWTVHQDRPLLTWRSGTARHCMACRRSGVQIPSVAPQVRAIIRPPSASDSTNPSRTAVARSASAIVTCSARTNRSTCGAIPPLPATSLGGHALPDNDSVVGPSCSTACWNAARATVRLSTSWTPAAARSTVRAIQVSTSPCQ